MKVIENNHNNRFEMKSQRHICRWCKSKLEYTKDDIIKGNIVLSQQEEYRNIDGLICPCCKQFDNINNGY
jgi:uncharacterized protein with PIN domain